MSESIRPVAASAVSRLLDLVLRLSVAAGLGLDAYVHANLASDFDAVGSAVTQGALFRVEAGAASLAALLVLLLPRRRWSYTVALIVAGSAFAAVLVYRYVNVGSLGPLPNMYEPIWYSQKTLSAIGEAAAAAAGALGVALTSTRWRR